MARLTRILNAIEEYGPPSGTGEAAITAKYALLNGAMVVTRSSAR